MTRQSSAARCSYKSSIPASSTTAERSYCACPSCEQACQHRGMQTQVDVHRHCVLVLATRCRHGRIDHRHHRDIEVRRNAKQQSEILSIHVAWYGQRQPITRLRHALPQRARVVCLPGRQSSGAESAHPPAVPCAGRPSNDSECVAAQGLRWPMPRVPCQVHRPRVTRIRVRDTGYARHP